MKKTKKLLLTMLAIMVIAVIVQSPIQAEAAKKFNVSNAQLKKALNGYSVTVTVNNKDQRFVVKSKEITKLQVKSKNYSRDKSSVTVKSVVYINRTVATVKASANMQYKLKGKKWKLSTVRFTNSSLSAIHLKGTWQGTYEASQGETKAVFNVTEVSKDGYASGVFEFSATPTNPTVPTGSYTFTGGYDKKTGKVTFAGDEWISRPSGYNMVDFYGYVDLKNKKIRTDNYKLSISKK